VLWLTLKFAPLLHQRSGLLLLQSLNNLLRAGAALHGEAGRQRWGQHSFQVSRKNLCVSVTPLFRPHRGCFLESANAAKSSPRNF